MAMRTRALRRKGVVREIPGSTARELANQVMDRYPAYFRSKFKGGFSPEYGRDPKDFMPLEERTYYQVDYNDRSEALVAVTFRQNDDSSRAAISLGRLFPKDKMAAPGWWYLREVICTVLLARGVKDVVARLKHQGGRQALKDLAQQYPNTVEVASDESSARVNVQEMCRD